MNTSAQTKAAECPHKEGTKAAAAWHRRKQKTADKAAKAEALAAAQQACRDLQKLPPDLANWGAVRTRAWINAFRAVRQQARTKMSQLSKVQAAVETMRAVLNDSTDMNVIAGIADSRSGTKEAA